MNWEEHKKELLKDPEFRKALKEVEPKYQVARALILARLKKTGDNFFARLKEC